jgi:GDP-4-dehydro-6-deoxy-D-mannose reductase
MTHLPAFNSAKLIVTGSSGFVGKHFCSAYGGVPLADEDGFVDLCNSARVHSAVAASVPEAVLHLAAQSSVAQSFSDPMATISTNFLGTLNLLQALSASGFRGVFVYVGSADVYGRVADAELPIRETQPLRPRSPYAVSKLAAEALCYQWSQTEKFRIVLTRPFTQIGPGQDSRFAVAGFARQVIEIRRNTKPPVLVTGDLDVTRDFTDVRDAVRAYRLLLERGQNGEVYNVCTGRERTLRSLLESLLNLGDVNAELQVDTTRLRPVEQRRMVGNPGKLTEQLGWAPEISIEKTLTDLLNEVEMTYHD